MTNSQRYWELMGVAAPMFSPVQLAGLSDRDRLALLVDLGKEVEAQITAEVVSARKRRISWADVGAALGLKATTAQKRYRDVAPVTRRRSSGSDQ